MLCSTQAVACISPAIVLLELPGIFESVPLKQPNKKTKEKNHNSSLYGHHISTEEDQLWMKLPFICGIENGSIELLN